MNYNQGATFWRSTWVRSNHGKTLASKRLAFLHTFWASKKYGSSMANYER
jgi:hypothetical protein